MGLPFFRVSWLFFAALVALAELGVLRYLYDSLGVSRGRLIGLLVLCLLGSYIDIPVATLPATHVRMEQVVDFFGSQYLVPVVINRPGTVVGLNVGGAVLPILLSVYLIFRHKLYGQSLLAVGIIAMVVHQLAQLVPGVGITVPVFIPPLITAVVALSISRWQAGPLAYIAGSLGTLVGADLMNLGKIQGLGAPMASIGGAGKFDGIVLTGIVAVLLAGILSGRRHVPANARFAPMPDALRL